MVSEQIAIQQFAEVFAFTGNSLLAPMSQTGAMGLEPAFWDAFPCFEDDSVLAAVQRCRDYAVDAQSFAKSGGDAVKRASVEYTRLFVGPPKPAASPWETFYGPEGATVGFGRATFEMRRLLREAGLEMTGENNQYADHIGIELLYLSVLCERAAAEEAIRFAEEHPLSWIDALETRVTEAEPEGYLACILALSHALMNAISNI